MHSYQRDTKSYQIATKCTSIGLMSSSLSSWLTLAIFVKFLLASVCSVAGVHPSFFISLANFDTLVLEVSVSIVLVNGMQKISDIKRDPGFPNASQDNVWKLYVPQRGAD